MAPPDSDESNVVSEVVAIVQQLVLMNHVFESVYSFFETEHERHLLQHWVLQLEITVRFVDLPEVLVLTEVYPAVSLEYFLQQTNHRFLRQHEITKLADEVSL
jgi:uncharacterized membrane protein YagU involved in acid resistance